MGPMRCLMLRDILVPAKSVARVGKKGKSQVGASKSASASCVKSPPLMFFFFLRRDVLQIFHDLSLTQVLDLKKKHSNCPTVCWPTFFFVPLVFEFGRSSSLRVYQSLFASLGVWWPLDDRCFFSCTTQDWSLGRYMFTYMFARYTYSLILIKSIYSIGTPDNEYYIYWFIF